MRYKAQVNSTGDIERALAQAEEGLKGADAQARQKGLLLCEEVLRRLLQSGHRDISVGLRGWGTPEIIITAPGEEDDLTEVPGEGKAETDRLEAEIGNYLLEQYALLIERDYGKDRVNRYRIHLNEGGDLRDEIFTYYEQSETAPSAHPMGVIWHIAKGHSGMAAFALINRTVKHLCALLLPVFGANIIDALSTCTSFWDAKVIWNIVGCAFSLFINLICATADARIYQRFTRSVESGFKMALVQKLQILSMQFYSETPTGKVLSKLVSDVQFVRMLLHEHFQTVLQLGMDIVFVIVMPQITQSLDSLNSINEVLCETDTEKDGTKTLPLPARGDVTFDHVVFGYARDQAPILKDVSFRVPSGKCAAFVGTSGTGKSTVLNLLLGLYAPWQGCIKVDDMDVNDLKKTSYRRLIAVVPQSPVLFSGTLWDNLVYGLQYVSAQQAEEVLRNVGLEDLITGHPLGLARPIWEGGENLSGGQRQRIAIARALLRKAKLCALCDLLFKRLEGR